jgi:hypothetical protein
MLRVLNPDSVLTALLLDGIRLGSNSIVLRSEPMGFAADRRVQGRRRIPNAATCSRQMKHVVL